MQFEHSNMKNPRIAFLLLLAFSITVVFFWVIKGFMVAVFVSAVLASILYPFYLRVKSWLGGRKGIAALTTVLLSLFLLIIPLMFFMTILVGEAMKSVIRRVSGLINRFSSQKFYSSSLRRTPN